MGGCRWWARGLSSFLSALRSAAARSAVAPSRRDPERKCSMFRRRGEERREEKTIPKHRREGDAGREGWDGRSVEVELRWVRTMVSPKARKRPTWVGDMAICASRRPLCLCMPLRSVLRAAASNCRSFLLDMNLYLIDMKNSPSSLFSGGSVISQCARCRNPDAHCAERSVKPTRGSFHVELELRHRAQFLTWSTMNL